MGGAIGGPLSWSTPPGFTGENQGAWEDSGDEEDVEDREAKAAAKVKVFWTGALPTFPLEISPAWSSSYSHDLLCGSVAESHY